MEQKIIDELFEEFPRVAFLPSKDTDFYRHLTKKGTSVCVDDFKVNPGRKLVIEQYHYKDCIYCICVDRELYKQLPEKRAQSLWSLEKIFEKFNPIVMNLEQKTLSIDSLDRLNFGYETEFVESSEMSHINFVNKYGSEPKRRQKPIFYSGIETIYTEHGPLELEIYEDSKNNLVYKIDGSSLVYKALIADKKKKDAKGSSLFSGTAAEEYFR